MRASTIEVLESDYIEMARLKGLSERTVLWRHAVPNAIGPTLQVIALNVAYLVTGVITIEVLFNYKGISGALLDAVHSHNMPLVQFIAVATGGPSKYEGAEMKNVHAGLHITNAEFDAAVGDLKASLDKFQIPNAEQRELLAIIESTRPQVVEPIEGPPSPSPV
jgi:hypothetical protein